MTYTTSRQIKIARTFVGDFNPCRAESEHFSLDEIIKKSTTIFRIFTDWVTLVAEQQVWHQVKTIIAATVVPRKAAIAFNHSPFVLRQSNRAY